MKPTVLGTASPDASGVGGTGEPGSQMSGNSVNIPINHQAPRYAHPPEYYQPQQQHAPAAYGSPHQPMRQAQPWHQQHQQPQQQPDAFQDDFGFDLDSNMDMFRRNRQGGLHHGPFAGFGASHFGFPQFGSLGRRRVQGDPIGEDDDFFNRLPNEFRQYIPENFSHRRSGSGSMPAPQSHMPQAYQQPPQAQAHSPQQRSHIPYYPLGQPMRPGPHYAPVVSANEPQCSASQPPVKTLCDAAIQTEDPKLGMPQDEVDNVNRAPMYAPAPAPASHLNHHGLRNTMDMGVKSAAENDFHGTRSQSAPPPSEQQQQQQHQQSPMPSVNEANTMRAAPATASARFQATPPSSYAASTQASATTSAAAAAAEPKSADGTYVRTIPIFVEGRSEPIINTHREVPTTSRPPVPPQQQQQQHTPLQQRRYQNAQQQQMPPLNTQQQAAGQEHVMRSGSGGEVPQTPHTLDSINKIQDIQRDVLDLMGKVETFGGMRKDKEYVYLDEMLTRNLLKLDTIDTNGKDSIRLARKEAIKCIQASINVLEAKAEENARALTPNDSTAKPPSDGEQASTSAASQRQANHSGTATASAAQSDVEAAPIPLPPPAGGDVDLAQAATANENGVSQANDAINGGATAAAGP